MPSRPTLPIRSGVATAASKSRKPPWMRCDQVVAADDVGTGGLGLLAPSHRWRRPATRAVLPVPWGRFTVPRTIWSALRGSTPRRSATSTVASNFVGGRLPGEPDRLQRRVRPGAVDLGRACAVRLAALHALSLWSNGPRGPPTAAVAPGPGGNSVADGDAHRPRRAGDDLLGGVEVVGVEVGQLRLGDLADLVASERADLGPVRVGAALVDARRPSRISFAAGGVLVTKVNERSSKIVISTGMTLPRWASVAALYGLQNSMMLTPCWPSAGPIGGAGVAWPALICSLTIAAIFFFGGMSFFLGMCRPGRRGDQILATWLNGSSTGVSRPKIETSTFSSLGVEVDLADRGGQGGERALHDRHGLADLERLLLRRLDLAGLLLHGRARGSGRPRRRAAATAGWSARRTR